jgi:hypothetical protein
MPPVRGPPTISTPVVVPATPAAAEPEITGAGPAPTSSRTAATSALREPRRLS